MVFLLSQYQHRLFGLVCKYFTGRIPYIVDLHRHRTLVKLSALHMSDIKECIHEGRYKVGYLVIEDELDRMEGDVCRGRKMRNKSGTVGEHAEVIVLHKLSDILQYLSLITIRITSDSKDREHVYTMEITSTSSSIFP